MQPIYQSCSCSDLQQCWNQKAFFDACEGSALPIPILKALMDQLVMKTFHARAGASFDSWKKNTARKVKGSLDAFLRVDLKSRVS